jgi:hypothetical protein
LKNLLTLQKCLRKQFFMLNSILLLSSSNLFFLYSGTRKKFQFIYTRFTLTTLLYSASCSSLPLTISNTPFNKIRLNRKLFIWELFHPAFAEKVFRRNIGGKFWY